MYNNKILKRLSKLKGFQTLTKNTKEGKYEEQIT